MLLDIEGTTTPIAFVYQTLFPYARANLVRYLGEEASGPEVKAVIDRLEHERSLDPDAPKNGSVVEYVHWLMDRDRKSTPLKELQGLIWEEGYARGDLTGDVFPDVPRALERWHRQGAAVGIFSSGSVLAQRLLLPLDGRRPHRLDRLAFRHDDRVQGRSGQLLVESPRP